MESDFVLWNWRWKITSQKLLIYDFASNMVELRLKPSGKPDFGVDIETLKRSHFVFSMVMPKSFTPCNNFHMVGLKMHILTFANRER